RPPPCLLSPLSLHDALPISGVARAAFDQAVVVPDAEPAIKQQLADDHDVRAQPEAPHRAPVEPELAARAARRLRHAGGLHRAAGDRKSTRLNSSHSQISYAV